MTYLDNAATSYPKPCEVFNALKNSMCLCGNPGRGGHLPSRRASTLLYNARVSVAQLFSSDFPENVVFTHNATEALNTAIKGLARDNSHILISDIEHNSVRRAVYALEKRGITFSVYESKGTKEEIIEGIKKKIKNNTKMLVACHRSNICPRTLPIEEIGALCKDKGIVFIVDASQSAGSLRISIEKTGAKVICAPGHKGLYSVMGCGFMLFSGNTDPMELSTLYEGGSGINSVSEEMPDLLPERLEAGTLPLPAICTLGAGADYVRAQGEEDIGYKENRLMLKAREWLSNMKNVKVYCPEESEGSVLLFNLEGMGSEEVAYYLDKKGVYVRAGLHCAPLAHQSVVGSLEGGVRASFGYFNTLAHVEKLCREVMQIVKNIPQKSS